MDKLATSKACSLNLNTRQQYALTTDQSFRLCIFKTFCWVVYVFSDKSVDNQKYANVNILKKRKFQKFIFVAETLDNRYPDNLFSSQRSKQKVNQNAYVENLISLFLFGLIV